MNIFWLDEDLKKCAEFHVDKHVVKMILELAQIMSTAHRLNDTLTARTCGDMIYKATHKNHPVVKWARQNDSHYMKVYNLWLNLLAEYSYRYGKIHKCDDLRSVLWCRPNAGTSDFIQPPQCMPDKYRGDDVIEAYRRYYIGEKSHIATWKNRPVPEWYKGNL